MNFFPQKETGISGGKNTYIVFMFGAFGGDCGGFELFVIKFTSEILEYSISITWSAESAQFSHSAIALCWVEEIT